MKQRSLSSYFLSFPQIKQTHIAWIVLILITLYYVVWVSSLSVLRYDIFKATAFDLGNMDQAIWNTINGRPFQMTNQGDNWYGPPTRLAIHFEPIILPLSVLYLIYPDPRTLLIFQTLALASGALPVFLLTRKYLPAWPLFAAVMAAAYLYLPALFGINLFDFHPVSLATPLLLYAVFALSNERYGWFVLACVLASACKEDIPLAVAFLGLLVIWKYKQRLLGLILFGGGMAWGLIAFTIIIPTFFPGSQGSNFWYRYEALGSSPGAAIINVLLHPWLPFTIFVTLDRIYYLAGIFRTSGFLSVFAPEWLLPALPAFAVNLLTTHSLIYSGIYQYNSALIPFVMLSAIHGARRIYTSWQQWQGRSQAVNVSAKTVVAQKGAAPVAIQRVTASLGQTWMALMQFVTVQPIFARSAALIQPHYASFTQIRQAQGQRLQARLSDLARTIPMPWLQWILSAWIIAMLFLNFAIMTPRLNILWPERTPNARDQNIEQLLKLIPDDAAVSAGPNINPHLSERRYITVFPTMTFASDERGKERIADYVIVDLSYIFPENRVSTANTLNQLINSRQFCIVKQTDGVMLLVRSDYAGGGQGSCRASEE